MLAGTSCGAARKYWENKGTKGWAGWGWLKTG
jgi:hypothetical protein